MRRLAQRGMLLLPVALTLAVVGALAYTMTREGSMSLSSVDADYDTETARYLAEAGLNLVKWQNQKRGCGSEVGFGSFAFPEGAGKIGEISTGEIKRKSGGILEVSLTATTNRQAVHNLSAFRTTVYDRGDLKTATLNGPGGNDTSITRDTTVSLASRDWLELTDGRSHAVIKFTLPSELNNGSVVSAELKLTQQTSNSSQNPRSLAVHRLTRDWGPGATWSSPWSTPGGDYDPVAAASVNIAGDSEYTWRIDDLVQGWANGTVDNQGVLLKPNGLLDARFYSLDAGNSYEPKLVVRYYKRC